MRRRYRVALAFLVALSICPTFVAAQALAPPSAPAAPPAAGAAPATDGLARIRAAGVLRVGTTGDYKPYTYLNPASGAYEGLDIDVARAFAASLGVRVAFVPTTWPTMAADLVAGKFDVAMGGVSESPERAAKGLLSHPYLTDGKVALVRREDRTRLATLAALDQPAVRVAVNPGGTNQKFVVANLTHANVLVVEQNLSIPEMVASGKADVMVTDGVEAELAARNDPRLVVADPAHPFTTLHKAYFSHLGDATFEAALDAFVDRSLNDGTYAKLRARWIGSAS
jgi:cyclohexadienyl dehydratase